jgi:hypothetical protein
LLVDPVIPETMISITSENRGPMPIGQETGATSSAITPLDLVEEVEPLATLGVELVLTKGGSARRAAGRPLRASGVLLDRPG